MVRRTALTIGILCVASAAASLAFRSDIFRVGSQLVERAASTGRGVAGMPALGTGAHGDGRMVVAPDERARAEYCPFPPSRGQEAATAIPADTLLGNSVGSTLLARGGQSRIPGALPPALCAGDTVGTPPIPRLAKP